MTFWFLAIGFLIIFFIIPIIIFLIIGYLIDKQQRKESYMDTDDYSKSP